MKIAVIGAGAIGALVAAKLYNAGEDVLLVGKKEQVDAITQKGLTVKGFESLPVLKLKVKEKLDQNYDLVIFAVKTQDIEQAYQDNHEFLTQGTILTTQNGVQADNLLSSHFEPDQMISSIVMFGATYNQPGEVVYNFPGNWIVGKPFTPNDVKMHEIADILGKAFPVVVSRDIVGMKWLKLFINFNNCIPALIGKSMQETFSDIDLCRLSIKLLREGVNIVKNAGIKMVSLPDFPVERIEGLSSMPEEQAAAIMNQTLTKLSKEPLYGSILQSIKRNKISEIDFINGEVMLVARSIAMKSPLNRKVVELVHQVEREQKFFDPVKIKEEFNLN